MKTSRIQSLLPWGQRWYVSAFILVGVLFVVVVLAFVADALNAEWAYVILFRAVQALVAIIGFFVVVATPLSAYRVWRSARELGSRHREVSANRDWKP